ncbi:MAG: chemotaxis protein CheC [Clostridia bacterium]|jgi:chemotaxis protein CheC
MNYENMSSMQMDVLKELGNIGAGNAVTALSKMMGKKVTMEVPRVHVLEFTKASEILGGAEAEVTGIYFRMEGDISGNIMFLLPVDSSRALLNMIMGGLRDTGEFGEMDLSALEEVGNILAGSYISSLSTMTGMDIKISVPALAMDMAGAVLSVPIIQFGRMGDSVLLIETHFFEGNTHVKGNFLLIPDVESFANLMKKLGVS